MKIENLIKLVSTMQHTDDSYYVDEKNIKKAEDFLEKNYFSSDIHETMVTAVGTLISHGEITNEDFEDYLNCLDNIRIAMIKCRTPRAKNMKYFVRVIGEASCAYNALVVSDLALHMYYGKCSININGETYSINPNDMEKLEILSEVIGQAQNKDQIHDVMNFYKDCSQLIDVNTRNILARKNLNGTKMAMNILKSYENCDDIPYLPLRLMANGEDEYIPLMQALEENVAVEGLQELQETFPGLDLSFEQYYVRRQGKEKKSSETHEKKEREQIKIKSDRNARVFEEHL